MKETPKKVVLAYSGGLDTSIIIPWLKENYGCEVVAMIGDVGQEENLEAARRKALSTGGSAAVVEDLRTEFVTRYLWPALRAGAVYEHKYLLGTALARPVLAKAQVRVALQVGADAVAHGCTGKGNDQVRFELAYRALGPQLKVIAPWREWSIDSREEAIAYAAARGIPIGQSNGNIYSRDRNIWHLSHEAGHLEDPANRPQDDVWQWTCSPEEAPDTPEEVEIGFEAGVPVAVDGKPIEPVELLHTLNDLGAAHGIGRVDMVENRLVGMKVRGLYETPGGTLLVLAHRELEALCLDRETAHLQSMLALRFAELIYYGAWFTPLREALDAFFAEAQKPVTGTVGLKLYKGNVSITHRCSPNSRYNVNLASFAMGSYNPQDATGFIKLFALPITPTRTNQRGKR